MSDAKKKTDEEKKPTAEKPAEAKPSEQKPAEAKTAGAPAPTVTLDLPTLLALAREMGAPRPPSREQLAAEMAASLADGEASLLRQARQRRMDNGFPDPAPGMKLMVRCGAALKGRRRAGIDFDAQHSASLEVTSLSTAEARKQRYENAPGPISVDEAEQILADSALSCSVFAPSAG